MINSGSQPRQESAYGRAEGEMVVTMIEVRDNATGTA
jgi:hypothetical protein